MKRTSAVTDGALAGIATGTWRIDPAHSSVTFAVRHLMSKVRGRFREVDGKILVGQALASCSVEASIATASVDTGEQLRDDDLRAARFFDSARFPSMRFSGRTTVRRSDFEVGDSPVEGSKVVIGDTVTVELDIEAFLEQ